MVGKMLEIGNIAGKLLVLKSPERNNVSDAIAAFNDPEVTCWLGVDKYTEEQQYEWFDQAVADPDHYLWAIHYNDRHIGNAGLRVNRQTQSALYDVVIWEKASWGKGIGTAVLKVITAHGFQCLDLATIYIDVYVPNIGSIRAAEKAGYQQYDLKKQAKLINGIRVDEWKGHLTKDRWLKEGRDG